VIKPVSTQYYWQRQTKN